MLKSKPFSVRLNEVVVEGGNLREPWVVSTQKLADFGDKGEMHFIQLSRGDRKLARAAGMDCTSRTPWGDNTFLAYVAHLRDEIVDSLIRQYLKIDDPMGEIDCAEAVISQRAKLYAKAAVPQVVEITYPAFTMPDGTRVPPKCLHVFSTPRRGGYITMELLAENLEFIAQAAPCCDFKPKEAATMFSAMEQEDHHMILEQANVVWRKRVIGGHASYLLFSRYRCSDGSWRTHTRTPLKTADEGVNAQVITHTAQEMQEFYDEHHVPEDA